MKKATQKNLDSDNKSYLESNPRDQRAKAIEVLAKAKAVEAAKITSGKRWVKIDHKTEVLR